MTAYHELDAPHDMRSDAARVGAWSELLGPGVRYEEFPRDVPKTAISIDATTARLAAGFDRG